jgi:hypothetical protein
MSHERTRASVAAERRWLPFRGNPFAINAIKRQLS